METLRKLSESKDERVKRNNTFVVKIHDLLVEEGFNPRTDPEKSKDVAAHIESITQVIVTGGTVPPLEVRVTDDKKIFIVDGHCRRQAYLKAIEQGCEIEWISVFESIGNDADRLCKAVTSSQGLSLTQLELADAYKRLKAFGWTPEKIALKVGKSRSYVDNILILANADSEVQQLVADNSVSPTLAVEIVRKNGSSSGKVIKEKLETAKKNGKKKVTAATTDPTKWSKKQISKIANATDKLIAILTPNLEKLADNTPVYVPASYLKELVKSCK